MGDTVSHECGGQCTCSPDEFPEFHCESPCMFEGETYSCRERVQWLVRERGSTVAAALDTVSHECGGQCMCSAADLGHQVTSPEPPQSESTTTQSTTLTPEASCRFSAGFCNGYSGGSSGEDTTTPPPPQNWELIVGECNPDGRGGAYRVDKPPSPNPFEREECGIVSPYFVHVEHYPEESCTSAKDDSSFMVFTDGACSVCCDINTHIYNGGRCCDINTGVCDDTLCAGFLSPA